MASFKYSFSTSVPSIFINLRKLYAININPTSAGADMLSVPLSKTIISNFELVVYDLVQKHQGNYLILHNFLQNYINNLLLFQLLNPEQDYYVYILISNTKKKC